MRRLLFVALCICCSGSNALADIIIDVGSHNLAPNTPGQQILIRVTGGEQVQGLDFNVLVADGGSQLGGNIEGPAITKTDIILGTIFQENNTGVQDLGVFFRQFDARSTTTASGTVVADGVLATLTIDTTGFFQGTFDLILSNTPNGPTDLPRLNNGVAVRITDGTIHVVPEPGSFLFGTVSLLACGVIRRRARRA